MFTLLWVAESNFVAFSNFGFEVVLSVLESFEPSSRGTWEKLADVVYSGGKERLIRQGPQAQGLAKSEWAKNICPHMDINNNKSPSFNAFRKCIETYKGA